MSAVIQCTLLYDRNYNPLILCTDLSPRNGLQLNPVKSGGADHRHNKPAASRHSIFIVHNSRWSRSTGGRRDEGRRSCAVPSPIVRSSRDIGGQGVQLSRPGHPAHPPSSDDRNGAHTGVQPDTVSAGLLQRCVARSSSQQYSEAAASAEHCGACRFCKAPDDHHLSHSSSSCIGSRFDNGLITNWPS